MKIAIDLQACQSPASRQRGIGRYSLDLAGALVRNRGAHEIHFLLNAAFDEHDEALRGGLARHGHATFEHYHLIHLDGTQGRRRQALQRVNDEILNWRYACAGANALHVSSVFEGWYGGEAHVSGRIGDVPGSIKSATLYDLIPLLFADRYLPASVRPDYLARLGVFQQFDLIFAISESARADAMRLLGIPPERIVNIRAATTGTFGKLPSISPNEIAATLSRYGLARRFILYNGGNDPRKNVDFLLQAYAALTPEIRAEFQLVIVCALDIEERRALSKRVADLGVAQQVVFTGYVADADLNRLYNLCELFVFPSLYEGFGLPVLEAMTCGACVIASGTSSMPEIVGRNDALFDPTDLQGLTQMMRGLLLAPDRRRELAAFGLSRSSEFSWDAVARTMLAAIEEAHRRERIVSSGDRVRRRPRVALFAPLPPQQTPAASYCAAMLPHWSRYFELDVVAEGYLPALDAMHGRYPILDSSELRRNRNRYEAVLYVFGDSRFHAPMYELLPEIPGIALMLDAFLSTLVEWMESSGREPGILLRELSTHGDAARLDVEAARRGDLTFEALVGRHPLSRNVPLHARGLVFQSRYARDLLARAYPDLQEVPSCVVPPASFGGVDNSERRAARSALGLTADDLLIGSFGVLDETRRTHVLIAALAHAAFAQDRRVRAAFVGELARGPYRTRIANLLERHPMRDRIEIMGPVDAPVYERYRAACDVAVDLEYGSHGATRVATHELLAAGRPTIVGDDAEMREFPDDVVWKVDSSDVAALSDALNTLVADDAARERLGASARQWIADVCHPARVAAQHAAAVTVLPALDRARCASGLVRRIAECVADDALEHEVTLAASDAVASGLALHPAAGRRLAERR